jgi:hypothetical protein
MRKWIILTGIVVLLGTGSYFGLSWYAVRFLGERLQRLTEEGLTIAEVKPGPARLSVKGVRFEEPMSRQKLLEIEEIRFYPSIFSALRGKITIREVVLVRPSFHLSRSREGAYLGAWISGERERMADRSGPRDPGVAPKERGIARKETDDTVPVKIEQLRIEGGTFSFEDDKVGEPPGRIELKEIDLVLEKIKYPLTSHPSALHFKARVKGIRKEGSVEARGWIDFVTSDMDVDLKVRDVELKLFQPYYRKRVTAEIESGEIRLDAKVVVAKKVINAPCQLDLTDLRLVKGQGTFFYVPADVIISLLKDRGNRVKAHFTIKGDTRDPKFSLEESVLGRLGFSVAESLGLPVRVIGETFPGGTTKGDEGLAKTIKALGEIFKKKREERK